MKTIVCIKLSLVHSEFISCLIPLRCRTLPWGRSSTRARRSCPWRRREWPECRSDRKCLGPPAWPSTITVTSTVMGARALARMGVRGCARAEDQRVKVRITFPVPYGKKSPPTAISRVCLISATVHRPPSHEHQPRDTQCHPLNLPHHRASRPRRVGPPGWAFPLPANPSPRCRRRALGRTP